MRWPPSCLAGGSARPAPRASGRFPAEEVAPNARRIDDHGIANVYLVIGTRRALLVDAGAGAADLRRFVQTRVE